MNTYDDIPDSSFVFGALLIVANRMDTQLERALSKHQITAKQWFLLMVLMSHPNQALTLKEAASTMGTSHQNVKMLALKLSDKGMLNLRKDPTDRRTTRLHLTEASLNFWRETEADGMAFMSDLYEGIPTSAFQAVRPMLLTLMNNLDRMDVQSRITSSDVLEEENQ